MTFDISDGVGLVAATLTTISFLPQVVKTVKTKDTSGLSLSMYFIFTLGVFIWVIFGIMIQKYVIVAANIFTFLLAFTILVMKIKNTISGKDK